MTPNILYQNIFRLGALTATDTASGSNVNNIADWRTFNNWTANSYGTKYVQVDLSPMQLCDSFALVNHNLGDCAATVGFEYWDESAWQPCLTPFVVSNNNVIYKNYTAQTAHKYRLKIVTASIAPRISILMAGASIYFDYPPDAPYIPISQSSIMKMETSKGGHVLGADVRYKPFTITAKIAEITDTMLGHLSAWFNLAASKGQPFIYSFNGDAFYVKVPASYKFEAPQSRLGYRDSVQIDMEGTIR